MSFPVDAPPRPVRNRAEERRRLLRWAVIYIDQMTNELEDCHKDPSGRVTPASARTEVRRCRDWVRRARAEIR